MAPGVQFIFNSNSKLNLGYRFQLGSDMNRMARSSIQLSFERTFLGCCNYFLNTHITLEVNFV